MYYYKNRDLIAFEKWSSQRPRTDRFVAPRESFDDLRRRHHTKPGCQRTSAIWYGKYVKQKKYASHIDKAFGLEPRTPAEKPEQTWPCVPRTRSHLSSADNILDLPTYSSAAFPELLDWSNDNILVAALGNQYYKWSWHSQSPIGKGFTLFNTACCRFDPTGERLALGTDMQRVEIHNAWSKWVAGSWCRCASLAQQFCLVTAVDWSPTGHSFVTGCSRGMVTSFDRDGTLISHRQYSIGAIFLIRVSPDARYVAAAAVNSPQVLVMLWPSLIESRAIGSDWIVKSLAWHPWRSALLGIGGVTELKSWIAIWDAPRACLRATTAVSNSDFSLDAMLFSHRTGELVLSLWNTDHSDALYWESEASQSSSPGSLSGTHRERVSGPPLPSATATSASTPCCSATGPVKWCSACGTQRCALLGIGGVIELKSWIAIWDAPRACLRATTAVSNSDFSLDAMLFSHRTGELVLSLWDTERQLLYPKASSQLVVMSGPDTVVDQWGEGRYGMDRVRTMVFSPDGTKLATATADEDLIIWNFLPQDNEPMKKTKRRKFSAMPTYIDQSTYGFSLR